MEPGFLGEWLIDAGAIDAKQLETATERMAQVNRRLDALAIERGWLTPEQAAELHREQLSRDVLWGALATEMGLLEPAQVDELLGEQGVRHVRLGEMLVELDFIDPAALERELEAFHESERVSTLANTPPPRLQGCEITCYILDHVAELSMRMGNLNLKLGAIETWSGPHDPDHIVGRIAVQGEVALEVGLEVDRAFCAELALGFMGVEPEELDEHIRSDLVREFLNVVVGNARSHAADRGRGLQLDVPEAAALEPPACAIRLRTVEGHGWMAFRHR